MPKSTPSKGSREARGPTEPVAVNPESVLTTVQSGITGINSGITSINSGIASITSILQGTFNFFSPQSTRQGKSKSDTVEPDAEESHTEESDASDHEGGDSDAADPGDTNGSEEDASSEVSTPEFHEERVGAPGVGTLDEAGKIQIEMLLKNLSACTLKHDELQKKVKKSEEDIIAARRTLVNFLFANLARKWTGTGIEFKFSWKYQAENKAESSGPKPRLTAGITGLLPQLGGARDWQRTYLQNALNENQAYVLVRTRLLKMSRDMFYARVQPELVACLCACALEQGLCEGVEKKPEFNEDGFVKVTLHFAAGATNFELPPTTDATERLAARLKLNYSKKFKALAAAARPAHDEPPAMVVRRSVSAMHAEHPELAPEIYSVTSAGGSDTAVKSIEPLLQLWQKFILRPNQPTVVLWVGSGEGQEIREFMKRNETLGLKVKIFAFEINAYSSPDPFLNDYEGSDLVVRYGCDCAFELAETVEKFWPHSWSKENWDVLMYTTALINDAFTMLLIVQLRKLEVGFFRKMRFQYVSGFKKAVDRYVPGNLMSTGISATIQGSEKHEYAYAFWKDLWGEVNVTERMRFGLLKDAMDILSYRFMVNRFSFPKQDAFFFPSSANRNIAFALMKSPGLEPKSPGELGKTLNTLSRIFAWAWDNKEEEMLSELHKHIKENLSPYPSLREVSDYMDDPDRYKAEFEEARNNSRVAKRATAPVPQPQQKKRNKRPVYEELQAIYEATRRPKSSVQETCTIIRRVLRCVFDTSKQTPHAASEKVVTIAIGMVWLTQINKNDLKPKQCNPQTLDSVRMNNLRLSHGNNRDRIYHCLTLSMDQNRVYQHTSIADVTNFDACYEIVRPYILWKNVDLVFADYRRMPTTYLDGILINFQLVAFALAMKEDSKIYLPFHNSLNMDEFLKKLGGYALELFVFEFQCENLHPLYKLDEQLSGGYEVYHDEKTSFANALLVLTRNGVRCF